MSTLRHSWQQAMQARREESLSSRGSHRDCALRSETISRVGSNVTSGAEARSVASRASGYSEENVLLAKLVPSSTYVQCGIIENVY